jgi:hypothetical protein
MNVPQSNNGELVYMVAPDGEIFEFVLDNGLESYTNLGTATFSFITSKAFKQDGSSLLDLFAEERSLALEYREICESRQQWWDRRLQLQAYFRPNRGGVFRLVVQQPEKIYFIRVIPEPGLEFADGDVTSLTVRETIRLRAFDPFWVQEDVAAVGFIEVTALGLIFPIIRLYR